MKLFIWDFHGVLEKGNDDAVVEITNAALLQHGYSRQLSREESCLLSGRRWHEYFEYLLPNASEEEWFTLQKTCFAISEDTPSITSKHINLNDYADHVLSRIHHSPHSQILISNTHPKALDGFVEMIKIGHYFPSSHRFGADSHTQKKLTKKDCLMKFLEQSNSFDSIISIGDSPGDMELIHNLGDQGIGYLYSHPHKEHRNVRSHHKINDLRLVLQELSDG